MKIEHASIYSIKDGKCNLFADTKTRPGGRKVTLEHEEYSKRNRILRIYKEN